MKNVLITILGLFLCISACKEEKKPGPEIDSEPAYSQEDTPTPTLLEKKTDSIRIIPIEHATAVIQWKDIIIYIDPVGGAKSFKDQEPADLILITDIHGDHFSLETLEELNTSDAKIMMPAAVAEQMPDQFTPQIDVLNNGDTKTRYGIKVEAIPMYNLRSDALHFHQRGRGNGYVLEMDGRRLYFSGDTEDIPEMRALKDIDMAFICMNLPYTMPVKAAASAVLEFKPKTVYPYHYRGRPEVSDVGKFRELITQGDTGIKVVQLDWYPYDEF